MSQVVKQPAYRLHKARNSAVVTLNGKNHYLGPWQSPESHEKYARLIAEWRRNNGVLPTPVCSPTGVLTVNELVLAYFRYAQGRYVKYGEATSEVACIRHALRHCGNSTVRVPSPSSARRPSRTSARRWPMPAARGSRSTRT
ncbi:MAG: hypothetical protein K2X82_33265 [Gemmataceae bacterium]|nr:hypothetical protein [Gemmataceae bacterium]